MFKNNIPIVLLCFLFNSCADSILDSSSGNIIEEDISIIGSWTSSDWCIYEDYNCLGNCVGGTFADLWILAETMDPRFTLTFYEDSTAQWLSFDDDLPHNLIFSKNLDGSYSLSENGDEAFQFKLSNPNILLYWLEDGRCIEFTLNK